VNGELEVARSGRWNGLVAASKTTAIASYRGAPRSPILQKARTALNAFCNPALEKSASFQATEKKPTRLVKDIRKLRQALQNEVAARTTLISGFPVIGTQ